MWVYILYLSTKLELVRFTINGDLYRIKNEQTGTHRDTHINTHTDWIWYSPHFGSSKKKTLPCHKIYLLYRRAFKLSQFMWLVTSRKKKKLLFIRNTSKVYSFGDNGIDHKLTILEIYFNDAQSILKNKKHSENAYTSTSLIIVYTKMTQKDISNQSSLI